MDKADYGSKPPKEGLCIRCKSIAPINRYKLCYECWVKSRLETTGWADGEPHPFWCGCSQCTLTTGSN